MRQLGELTRLLSASQRAEVALIGVSPDSVPTLKMLSEKQIDGDMSTLTLLADIGHKVISRYGLLNEKSSRGLPHPTTLVIDREGVVRWRFTEKNYRVRPTNEMILEALGPVLE